MFISSATGATKLATTDTKLYVQDVTLSTQDNAKPFQKLKSSFKRTVHWIECQSKVTIQEEINLLFYRLKIITIE